MKEQPWTPEKIDQIRACFLNGLEIKQIAQEIGKSPTAVNKALSRFGIRHVKRSVKKATIKASMTHKYTSNDRGVRLKSFLKLEHENWVSFYKVCDYLKSQKTQVVHLSASYIPLPNQSFLIGTKTRSAMQVLFMANKLRTEQNLSTLFVKNLSW